MAKIANRTALLKLCERRYIDLELEGGLIVRIQSLSEKEKSSYNGDIWTRRKLFGRAFARKRL